MERRKCVMNKVGYFTVKSEKLVWYDEVIYHMTVQKMVETICKVNPDQKTIDICYDVTCRNE